jgi:hypothetical protein
MLGIEDHLRPHPVVEHLLVKVITPLLPTWPLTPGGGEAGMLMAMKDREFSLATFYTNDLGPVGAKLRLKTAVELGIVGCTWIQEHLAELRTPFLIVHAVSVSRCCSEAPLLKSFVVLSDRCSVEVSP